MNDPTVFRRDCFKPNCATTLFNQRDSAKITDVARPKVPRPSDVRSAAESVMETAQAVASGAMRLPPESAQFAMQLPDLLENLAVATERLNTTIDRMERYMALADPMFRTMDRLVPQLEALIATGNDVFGGLSGIPGVATLSRGKQSSRS